MEQICATAVVQFLQCSLHCAMWPVYICKWLLGQYYCIVCLFVCCVSYVYCLSLEQLCEKDQVFIVETKPSFVAVVYPKTNRCDSKGVQARPGVIQKTPRMSKHRCHTCKGREGCYHLVIFNLAKHEDTKVKNLERNLSL